MKQCQWQFFLCCAFSVMKQTLQKVVTLSTSKKRPFNIYHLHLTLAKHEPLKKQLRKTTATIIFLFFLTFLYFFFDFFIFMDNGFCSLPAIIHNSNCRSQKYISPIVCLIDFGHKIHTDFHKNEIFQQYELVLHQLYFWYVETNHTADPIHFRTKQTKAALVSFTHSVVQISLFWNNDLS